MQLALDLFILSFLLFVALMFDQIYKLARWKLFTTVQGDAASRQKSERKNASIMHVMERIARSISNCLLRKADIYHLTVASPITTDSFFVTSSNYHRAP